MAYEILKSIIEVLEPLDVEHLKYILRGNFTGRSYWISQSRDLMKRDFLIK